MIDRRIFLQLSSGAAASSAALVTTGPTAAAVRAMPVSTEMAVPVQVGDSIATSLVDPLHILSERLALATDGRLTLQPASSSGSPGADCLVLSGEDAFADAEPVSHLLGGSPFCVAAAVLDVTTWLKGMGGQALWDMSAARAGWKPLMIGRTTRADAEVWSREPLASPRDLVGQRVAASRVVSAALEALGAIPVCADRSQLLSMFQAGELDVFEIDDPAISFEATRELSPGTYCYVGNLAGTHRVLSLRLPLALWEHLALSDRTILQAVAEETAATVHAVRRAHSLALFREAARTRGRRRWAVSTSIRVELATETAKALQDLVARDPVFESARAGMLELIGRALKGNAVDWEQGAA